MNWFRQNRFKKLNYTPVEVDGVTFYVARSSTRSMHITVKSDLKAYAVCNYVTSEAEFTKFLRDHVEWVKKAVEEQKKDMSGVNDTPVTNEERERLRKKIDIYVKRYEVLMGTKVKKWSIRDMSARWGSCTVEDKTIRFALNLAHCSDEFIEYLVVHEMAHLFVASHSREFWNIVEKYIPDFKLRKHMYTEKGNDA